MQWAWLRGLALKERPVFFTVGGGLLPGLTCRAHWRKFSRLVIVAWSR